MVKRDRVNRCVMPWIFACVVLLSCPAVLAQTSDGGESSTEGAGGIRFAIGLVEDLPTYSEPRAGEPDGPFDMPILSPHRIVDERTVDGELWHQIERREGRTTGWVPGRLVAVWNSRHALRPNLIGSEGVSIPGYCESEDVARAVAGDSDPCMTFVPEILDRSAERAPFPVLGVSQHRSPEGVEKTYFHVLAPTLYSNIAPVLDVGGGSEGSGSVEELTEALGGTAKTLEVIILIDATGSMRAEIEEAAAALADVVADLAGDAGVDGKFMVVAYRDTDGASDECPAMEGTVDSANRLEFTDAAGAKAFLKGLSACEGGDVPEAIWDALYLLKDIGVDPGANRALILAGDAPSHTATRGMSAFGTTVPAGVERADVFTAVEDTIGHSTTFVGLLAQDGVRATAEEIMGGLNLYDKDLITLTAGRGEVKEKMVERVKKGITSTKAGGVEVETCQREIAYDDTLAQVGLFCGSADDPELAARIRDLVDDDMVIVVRELWVPQDRSLDDVALVSRKEAKDTATSMAEMKDLCGDDGSGCADEGIGPAAWVEVMDKLVPGDTVHTPGAVLLTQPFVGADLHKYWDLHVGAGGSIIKYQPATLKELDPESCKKLGEKLHSASQFMLNSLSAYSDLQFLWFPFDQLP